MIKQALRTAVPVVVLAVLCVQFVQPERTNPPHDSALAFETVAHAPAGAVKVVRRACYDCHSNQTVWPWYASISPASWLVAADVKEGRAKLNFSEWHRYGSEMSDIRRQQMCAQAKAGKMPMWKYTLLHPEAKLSDADLAALCSSASASRYAK